MSIAVSRRQDDAELRRNSYDILADVSIAVSRRQDDVPDEDVPTPGTPSDYPSFSHIRIKTDAQGRWCAAVPPARANQDRRLWFQLEHPDYVSDTGGYARRLSNKTARAMTGVFVMNTGYAVSGQVRDGNGRPVPGARVVLAYSGNSGDCLTTTTDALGNYRFSHANDRPSRGGWSVCIEAAGFGPVWKVVAPRAQLPPLDFRLSAGKPFRGRVVNTHGTPVAGVAVWARWEECCHLDWKTITDAQGGFTWPDAPPDGVIEFSFRQSAFSDTLIRRVAAAVGQAEFTIASAVFRARRKVPTPLRGSFPGPSQRQQARPSPG